jgi:hypothetical protein
MNTKPMNKGTLLLASAAAGLLTVAASLATPGQAQAEEVKCYGVNKCKGTGACGGKGHSCAGKNECAGKGWIKTNADDCKAQGGSTTPPADEAPKHE